MSGRAAIEAVLDEFHAAAGAADEERYLATVTGDMVFLGTAPGERWQGGEWRDFVHSYFSRGKGWTYVPSDRTIAIDASGLVAWFDETVDNEHFGSCRGTGVVRQEDGAWRIAQYNLTIPVPDALVPDLVSRIGEVRPA